jgi:hypothetical protein
MTMLGISPATLGKVSRRSPEMKRNIFRSSLMCEALEGRQLMATDILTVDSTVFEDIPGGPLNTNGQFEVTGVKAGEVVELKVGGSANSQFGTDYDIEINGLKFPAPVVASTLTYTVPASFVGTILSVDVNAIDDNLFDGGDETVTLDLVGGKGSSLSASLKIVDNESKPSVSLAAGSNATEPSTNGNFVVSLVSGSTNLSDVDTTVTLSVPTGAAVNPATTAVDASDMKALNGVVATIAAGQSTVSVPVQVLDDGIVEGSENVTVTISSPTGNGIALSGTVTQTIKILDEPDSATVKIGAFDNLTIVEGAKTSTAVIEQTKLSSTPTVVQYSLFTGTTASSTLDFTTGLLTEAETNNTVFGPQAGVGAMGVSGFSLTGKNPNNTAIVDIVSPSTVPHLTIISTAATNKVADRDVYAFYAAKSGAATFDIDNASFNTFLTLYDSTGAVLKTNDNAPSDSGSPASSFDAGISFTLPAAGVYYIEVAAGDFKAGTASDVNTAGKQLPVGDVPSGASYTLHLSVPDSEGYAVIASGQTSVPITITTIDDSLLEPDEFVKIRLDALTLKDDQITFLDSDATKSSRNADLKIADNDKTTITITSTKAIEATTNGVFTFTQPLAATVDSVLTLVIDTTPLTGSTTKSLANGTLSNPADHKLAETVTVTIPQGTTQTTLTVDVIDSDLLEEDETLVLTVTKFSGDADITVPATAKMEFGDDDKASIAVDVTTAFPVEGKSGNFSFFLFNPDYPGGKAVASDRDTVIEYVLTGSAITGSDTGLGGPGPITGTFTLPAFQTSADLVVNVNDDNFLEPTEQVTLTITKLLSGSDSNILPSVGSKADTMDIIDNDSLAVIVSKTLDTNEGGTKGIFTFETAGTGISLNNTVVEYVVKTGIGGSTATENVDFKLLTGTVTILAGAAGSSATVEIDATGIFDDNLLEGDETVILQITKVSGDPGLAGVGNFATGKIIDDETGAVKVNDPAFAGKGLFFDGAEGSTDGQFLFTLGGASPLPVVIEYTVKSGQILPLQPDATPGSDYASIGPTAKITFAPFQTSTVVVVDVSNDTLSEVTEGVRVQVTNVLSGKGYSPDPTEGIVQIFSDQEVVVFPQFNGIEGSVIPGSFALFLTTPGFGLTSSTTDTVVTYQILTGNSDDAANTADYKTLSGVATIPANSTSVVITVAVEDDSVVESTEKVRIKLLTLSSGDNDITISKVDDQATITITDNDAAYVTVKATKTPGQDNPGTDVDGAFTFFLSQPSSTDTVVEFTIGGSATPGSDYGDLSAKLTPTTGTITILAKSTSAVLPVDVFNDPIVEGTETVKITMTKLVSADPDIYLGAIGGPVQKFQQGFLPNSAATTSYTGTQDTYISLALPLVNFDGGDVEIDTDSLAVPSTAAEHGLIRFDNIFGAGLIPLGSPIAKAELTLTSFDNGPVSFNEMLVAWSESTATWTGFFGNDGIQAGDEALKVGVASNLAAPVDVTSSVAGWSAGGKNLGWAVLPQGKLISAGFESSEDSTPGERPLLTVTVDLSATVEILDTDTATVSVSKVIDAAEPTTKGQVIVSLSTPSSTATKVYYTDTKSGTAGSGSDYNVIPDGFVIIAANQTSTIIEVTAKNDSLIESPESVIIKLTGIDVSADPEIKMGSPDTGTVIINDDDFGVISFGTVVNGSEGIASKNDPSPGSVVIQLSTPSDTDTVIGLTVSGTAVGGDDFQKLPLSVTIPANFFSTTLIIDVIDDGINEAPIETVKLTLDPVSGNKAIFGTPISTIVNIADDEQPLVIDNIANKNAIEGTQNGEFLFQLNYPSDKETVVYYQVLAGSATSFSGSTQPDYDITKLTGITAPGYTTGTVTIAAKATNVSLPVIAFQDFVSEGTETVDLKITKIENVNVGSIGIASSKVNIDDLVYEVKVRKTDSPAAEPGPIPGSNGQYTFTLTNPLPAPTVVTFTIATSADTFQSPAFDLATGLADYKFTNKVGAIDIKAGTGTVTIPANTTTFVLSLDVIDDDKVELDETVTLTLTGASSTSSPGAPYVWGNPTVKFDLTPAIETITDNDKATVSVSGFSGQEPGVLVSEEGKIVFTQNKLSATDTVITFEIVTKSSTATAGSDYKAIVGTQTVTILANSLTTSVVLDVVDDFIIEPTETISVKLLSLLYPTSLPTAGTTDPQVTVGTDTATVSIVDDDTATVFMIPTSSKGYEPGTNDGVFTVFLTPGFTSTEDIVVTFNLDPTGDADPTGAFPDFKLVDTVLPGGKLLNGSVTIPAGKTSATIVVDVLDDNVIENDETVKVKLVAVTGTPLNVAKVTANTTLQTVTIQDLTGLTLDQDTATVKLSVLNDGDENKLGVPIDGKYLLTLTNTNPLFNTANGPFFADEDTVVTYQIVGGSAVNGVGFDYDLTVTGSVTISKGNTTAILTVPVLEDVLAEMQETIDVKLTGITKVHTAAISADPSVVTMKILDDDASVLTISSEKVTEGDSGTTKMIFTVTSPTEVSGGFDVTFKVADVTTNKSGPGDYTLMTSSPLKFNGMKAGETQTIWFDITGDTLVEATESFTVTLDTATPGVPLVISGAVGTGTITNDDTAVFTIEDVSEVEGTNVTPGGPATTFTEMEFEIKASNKIDVDTLIDISTLDLSALGFNFDANLLAMKPVAVPVNVLTGFDYDNDSDNVGAAVPFISQLTFSKNIDYSGSGLTFKIRVIQDNFVEGGTVDNFGGETFKLKLDDLTGTRSINVLDTAIGTITDDDTAVVTLTVSDAKASEPFDTVNEGNGQFLLTQSALSSSDTVITYTVSGDAVAGTDYKMLSGIVTIPAGKSTAVIDVIVLNNPELEVDEKVTITIDKITSSDPNVSLVSKGQTGTVTIFDDDSATVKIVATDNAASEDPLDNGQFTLTLSDVSATDTVVTYAITTGLTQATNGSDYATLSGVATIPAGKTTTTIDVVVLPDVTPEGAETVTLTLTGFLSPTNADIKIDTANNDTVTIADDVDGIRVSVYKLATGTEGASDGAFVVKITKDDLITPVVAPLGGLAVSYSSLGGTASDVQQFGGPPVGHKADYVGLSGVLFIPAGSTSLLIPVVVNDDSLVETTETVQVTLSTLTHGGFPGGEPATVGVGVATVEIIDNDKANFTINSITVNEGVGTATLTVSLSNPIDIATTVDVKYTDISATGGNIDYDSATDTVAFAVNTVAPQTVTVKIIDDSLTETLEVFQSKLSSPTVLGGRSATFGTGAVAINDNEVPILQVLGVKAGMSAPSAAKFLANVDPLTPVGQKGFTIPSGPTILPWTGIDTLFVMFNEDVNPATLTGANVKVFGVLPVPGISGAITFDAATDQAKITFSTPLPTNRYRVEISPAVQSAGGSSLDGDANNVPGGVYNFLFNVLLGDANQGGNTDINDVAAELGVFGAVVGGAGYNPYIDVDASGNIDINDVAVSLSSFGAVLPMGAPGGSSGGGFGGFGGSGTAGSGDANGFKIGDDSSMDSSGNALIVGDADGAAKGNGGPSSSSEDSWLGDLTSDSSEDEESDSTDSVFAGFENPLDLDLLA